MPLTFEHPCRAARSSPTVADVRALESAVASAQAALDQAQAALADGQAALSRRRAALLRECERMLSGDLHCWEARDPQRVIARLTRFVEEK